MQVFVKLLNSDLIVINVEAHETVLDVKRKLQERGHETDYVNLCGHGRIMHDHSTMKECNVEDLATFHVLAPVVGGAKKRKKKNYSTPKKLKHKKKKCKLAILKFFKVDDNNTVQRLRKECTSEQCSMGSFMAAHDDRHYCGNCGHTVFLNKQDKE